MLEMLVVWFFPFPNDQLVAKVARTVGRDLKYTTKNGKTCYTRLKGLKRPKSRIPQDMKAMSFCTLLPISGIYTQLDGAYCSWCFRNQMNGWTIGR